MTIKRNPRMAQLNSPRMRAALHYARKRRIARQTPPFDADPQSFGATDGSLSTSNYSNKVNFYTLSANRSITEIEAKLNMSGTVHIFVAEIDALGEVLDILSDGTESITGTWFGSAVNIIPATPIALTSGKRYAIGFRNNVLNDLNIHVDLNDTPSDDSFVKDGLSRINDITINVGDNIDFVSTSAWGYIISHENTP